MKRTGIWPFITLTCALNLVGCNADDLKEVTSGKTRNGFWVSEAHGEALDLSQNSLKRYEFTDDYCVHSATEILTDDEHIYSVDGDQLTQYLFPDLAEGKEDYTYVFVRSESLPESCQTNQVDATMGNQTENPERDLEIFLQNFEQYYYSFAASGVDWTSIEQKARSQVSPQTSRDELFQILSDAIEPLQNGHVGIVDHDKVAAFKRADKPTIYDRFNTEFLTENNLTLPLTDQQEAAMTEYTALNLGLTQAAIMNYLDTSTIQSAANDNMIWGRLISGNYGYLNVLGFSELTDTTDDENQMLETMHQVMQQVLADLGNTDGLVIDLRFNGGGYPFLARALSEYFVSQITLGYSRSLRYGNHYSPEEFIYLSPKTPFYGENVVVLISNTTASAAEMATLMLQESPHVTLIGENTQGMHSGNQQRVLPNGFIFSISNIRQLSASGESYEQRGIPADIAASFATKEDRAEGKDSGLEAALKWLQQSESLPDRTY